MQEQELNEADDIEVQGTLKVVSPMKSTDMCKKFYDGEFELTEPQQAKKIRLVCFGENLHCDMRAAVKRKIKLDHIKVAKAKYSKKTVMELHVNDNCCLEVLDDGNYGDDNDDEESWINIKDVLKKEKGERVNLKAKILRKGGEKFVNINGERVKKVVCTLVDKSGMMDLVLWGQKGSELEEGKLMAFKYLMIHAYGGVNYVKYSSYTDTHELNPGIRTDGDEDCGPSTSKQFSNIKIIGIDGISWTKNCNKCQKPVKELAEDEQEVMQCECGAFNIIELLNDNLSCVLRVCEPPSEKQRTLKVDREVMLKMIGDSLPSKVDIKDVAKKVMGLKTAKVDIFKDEIVDIVM